MMKDKALVVTFVILISISSTIYLFLSSNNNLYASNKFNTDLYLPLVNKPHCTTHNFLLNTDVPSTVVAGASLPLQFILKIKVAAKSLIQAFQL